MAFSLKNIKTWLYCNTDNPTKFIIIQIYKKNVDITHLSICRDDWHRLLTADPLLFSLRLYYFTWKWKDCRLWGNREHFYGTIYHKVEISREKLGGKWGDVESFSLPLLVYIHIKYLGWEKVLLDVMESFIGDILSDPPLKKWKTLPSRALISTPFFGITPIFSK